MAKWTDQHSRLVREARPHASDMDLDQTWVVVRRAVDAPVPPVRSTLSRARSKLMVGAAVAAAVAGLSGVAVAAVFTARTGEFPRDAEGLRLGGPGEILDPAASDFREVIDEETRDIVFPNRDARAVSINEHVRDLSRGSQPARVTTGALRAWTAEHAVCAWSNEWVTAIRTGDTAGQARAASMLVSAQDWPAVTAIDPVQKNRTATEQVVDSATGEVRTETFEDPTQFYYLQVVSRAVMQGDINALGKALADDAYCIGPSLVPAFPAAFPPGVAGR